MKAWFLILFMVLALPLVFAGHVHAAGIEDRVLQNPAGVNELTIQIVQYGSVAVDGSPTKFIISLETPQEDGRQDVSTQVNKTTNGFGTEVAVIERANPPNPFAYNFSTILKSRASHLVYLPSSYSIPNDAEAYLRPTENMQSSEPAIRQLAEQITKGSKDDFEKVARLAMWVHDNLVYDISYYGRNLDALAVLNAKRGVCAEYTTLFIAFARSVGIPAKFVSSYAYGQMGWERHAYAEAYLGEWVPVDALWMEIGFMDATHIKFGSYADNKISNSVTAYGYDLKGGSGFLEDNTTFYTLSASQVEKEENYQLDISSGDFRKGDEGLVSLSLVPGEFIVGRLTLEPCAGEQKVVDVEDKEKNVILRPGVKEQIYWKIKVNPDLPRNYVFTCPLTLNSRSLALKEVNASADTQYAARSGKKLSARLYSSALKIGGGQKVYISLAGTDGPARLGVIAGNEKEEWDVNGDFQTVFSFRPAELGENEVVVYTSEGEVVPLEYTVESDMRISIQNFTAPQYLKTGEAINISAYVVNSGAPAVSVRADMMVEGEESMMSFMLGMPERNFQVSLPVSFKAPGPKTFRLEVSGAGINISETRVIEVYDEPVIRYETDYSDGKAVLRLSVSGSKIRNVTVTVGGQEQKLDEVSGQKDLEFPLAPGAYTLDIACSDVAGNPYKVSGSIEFREKNIFEKILEMINDLIRAITSLFAKAGQQG
jgi:hypothetical protein